MALSKEEVIQIAEQWCSGMSPEQINFFVMRSHVTKERQIKQALLEVEQRYHNLQKVVIQNKRTLLEIKKIKSKLEKCEDEFERESLLIDLEDLEIDNETYRRKKKALDNEFDCFIKYLQDLEMPTEELEKYLSYDEEQERKYWIARLGKQAALDLATSGRIGIGNMDSIAMLSEEDQLATIQVAVQYSGLLNVSIGKIQQKLMPYLQDLERSDSMALPTFHGIEENLEVPLLKQLKEYKGELNGSLPKGLQSSTKSKAS
jgi:hypothetical protein